MVYGFFIAQCSTRISKLGDAEYMLMETCAGPESTAATPLRPPRIVVFDSGLGGITVLDEIVRAVPDGMILFAADDAVFPYGLLDEAVLIDRVLAVMERLVAMHRPDMIVIACNTASTLVLPPLRARWPTIAIVGTVPAIKPAAAASRSGLISVLATPGTVARQYTRELVRAFADGREVLLVGSTALAALAEGAMRGEEIADASIAAEIRPAFVDVAGRRTDAIVLACTHYPLLLERMTRLAPWPVTWIDPAPAIARRVCQVARERGLSVERAGIERSATPIPAIFTTNQPPGAALAAFLSARHIVWRPDTRF